MYKATTGESESRYRVGVAIAWLVSNKYAAVQNRSDFTGGDLPYDHAHGKVDTTSFLGFLREQGDGFSYHRTTKEAAEYL